MHEGARLGRARLRRLPVGRRERHGRARPRARRLRGAAAPPPAPLRARVGRGAARAHGGRRRATAEVDAAPPLPDRRGRAHARPEREDEPAASRARTTARRWSRRCATGRSARSQPTTRRTRGTRRRCRSRRRRSASPGSRRRSPRSTRTSSSPASSRSRRCSSGCAPGRRAIYGLEAPRIAVGAPANLVLLDLDASWRVERRRLPLAVGELVAPRRDAAREGAADGRRRQAGATRHDRLPRARGRDRLPRRVGRRRGHRVRRGRLHDRDDRLPGDRHRPELRRAARLLHGADGRQLRRRRRSAPSPARRARARRASCARRAGRRGRDWLARARRRRARRGSTRARSSCASASAARCGRRSSRATPRSSEALARRARAAGDGRARARRRRLDAASRTRTSERGRRRASRSSTTAASARSSRRLRGRRGGDRLPARRRTPDELAGYDGVLLSNGPGDPAPLADEVETVAALLGRVPILGICLGHQLLALAAGLETFKLPFGHRGANHPVLERATGRVLVTSQNHGFAVEAAAGARGDARLALRRHRRGPRLPGAARRSRAVPPEAGPGPHDAWPLIESWVEEVRGLAEAA